MVDTTRPALKHTESWRNNISEQRRDWWETPTLGELVQLQSWEDTLPANKDVVVNFKYDGEFKGKSTARGVSCGTGQRYGRLTLTPSRLPFAKHYTAT